MNCALKLDCFSILVGRKASSDGSVLFAHNEDTGARLVNYCKVPPADHAPGEEICLRNGGRMPQAEHTLGYLWLNIPGADVCDSYVNECGVVIGSDGCPSREDRPELTDGGIVFWLRRAVAERARTAREGVEIAGKLIDRFGYASSGRSYVIADANEGWILCAVHGKHWFARKVPDDKVAIIANCYTMREVTPEDTANCLGSPDIVNYAAARGWYDRSRDGAFSFARAYADPRSLTHRGNLDRMWRAADLVSEQPLDGTRDFPFLASPRRKLAVRDLMRVLRDHHEGTNLDVSPGRPRGNPHRQNKATICAETTQYSFVAHLRNWMPAAVGCMAWIAPYRPCVQAYCPWYSGITGVPGMFSRGDAQSALACQFAPPAPVDALHAFQRFAAITNRVDRDYERLAPPVREAWLACETGAFRGQADFEREVSAICGRDPRKAAELLTKHSAREATVLFDKAGDFLNEQGPSQDCCARGYGQTTQQTEDMT